MALVEHESPADLLQQPPITRGGLKGPELVLVPEDTALADKKAELAFLRRSGTIGILQKFAPLLPGKVKIGISRLVIDKPMNIVMSFDHEGYSLNELLWRSVVVGTVKNEEGYALTINGGEVQKDQGPLDIIVAGGIRAPYIRTYSLIDSPRQNWKYYRDEMLMKDRERIKF